MRKLVTIILTLAAFVGGYYAGRLPGAPDIFEVGKEVYVQAESAVDEFAPRGDGSSEYLACDSKASNSSLRLGGKFYQSHHVAIRN